MTRLGAPVDRMDGPLKVTGAAPYPSDVAYPDMAYAALVRSTIAAGRILEIDVDAARAVDGVQAVITHLDAPCLGRAPAGALGLPPPAPLQDNRILHYGQYVAVVVADTPQQANEAAHTGRIRSRSGRERPAGDPGAGESYVEILARNGLAELTADGESTPPDPAELGMAPSGAFAAKFVEVRVDRDLGRIRVARMVSVVDGGRILNEKLARSQVIGGTVGGIGQAIFEETIADAGTGRIANATFGDYLVPVTPTCPTSTSCSWANRTG
jgi:CO/xanthine dehydrogenase Mo-binding subunit